MQLPSNCPNNYPLQVLHALYMMAQQQGPGSAPTTGAARPVHGGSAAGARISSHCRCCTHCTRWHSSRGQYQLPPQVLHALYTVAQQQGPVSAPTAGAACPVHDGPAAGASISSSCRCCTPCARWPAAGASIASHCRCCTPCTRWLGSSGRYQFPLQVLHTLYTVAQQQGPVSAPTTGATRPVHGGPAEGARISSHYRRCTHCTRWPSCRGQYQLQLQVLHALYTVAQQQWPVSAPTAGAVRPVHSGSAAGARISSHYRCCAPCAWWLSSRGPYQLPLQVRHVLYTVAQQQGSVSAPTAGAARPVHGGPAAGHVSAPTAGVARPVHSGPAAGTRINAHCRCCPPCIIGCPCKRFCSTPIEI